MWLQDQKRWKKKPNTYEYFSVLILDLNSEYLDLGFGRGGPMSAASRAKRMRTSFKHHQLRTMKTYFQINHNPDAKDLKQLSQKTGLPKRVLQVSILFKTKTNYFYLPEIFFRRKT